MAKKKAKDAFDIHEAAEAVANNPKDFIGDRGGYVTHNIITRFNVSEMTARRVKALAEQIKGVVGVSSPAK